MVNTKMFFYEAYEFQWDDLEWEKFEPDSAFVTNIQSPSHKKLEGYDIVTHTNNIPECSYLSCNSMAQELIVNKHCLLETFEYAKNLLEKKVFTSCEPGPCRIIAVYSIHL